MRISHGNLHLCSPEPASTSGTSSVWSPQLKDWTNLTLVQTSASTASAPTGALVPAGVPETRDIRGMEGCSKPEPVPPGPGGTSAMSGPLLSGSLEKLHHQTDSVLTAARLVRRGWTEEGKKTGWQVSYFNSSRQPSVSGSGGNQCAKRAEIFLKEPRSRRVPVVNSGKTAEDRWTGSDKPTDEAKQTEGSFSANRQTGLRIVLSGCRTTFRQSRRFKAPILPVIAEM
ncbi:hypothetical protein VZT92_006593 [Zoarces viviparus]|uniref:Uncharacterized protein n=1 Tax=Zoarces viviparus TaxID=48416 RepID=A0AAW1FRH1_ZOAVI